MPSACRARVLQARGEGEESIVSLHASLQRLNSSKRLALAYRYQKLVQSPFEFSGAVRL